MSKSSPRLPSATQRVGTRQYSLASAPVLGSEILAGMPFNDDPLLGEIAPTRLPNANLPKHLANALPNERDVDVEPVIPPAPADANREAGRS